MNKIYLTSFLIILVSFRIQAQNKELKNGYIVTHDGDTIYGQLEIRRNNINLMPVKIINNDAKLKLSKRKISEIVIENKKYIKSYNSASLSNIFFYKGIVGNTNIYYVKKQKYIGKHDSDLYPASRASFNLHCDDLPISIRDSIGKINRRTIDSAIVVYNEWKLKNPSSLSFYEKNIHYKKPFILRTSFLMPGVGAEIKLSNSFSINSMMRLNLGFNSTGLLISPNLQSDFRYYYNLNKRERENKMTYNFNANYFGLVYQRVIFTPYNFFGLEFGMQASNKKTYSLSGYGIGYDPNYQIMSFWFRIDVGFAF